MINYDMDVTAFTLPWQPDYKHQRGELPFTNWRDYEADPHLLTLATNVSELMCVRTGVPCD